MLRRIIIILSCTSVIFMHSQILKADGALESKVYPVNEATYNKLKETVCKNVPILSGETDQNLKWSDTILENEIYELAFLTLGYQLTSQGYAHLPFDLGWKKTVLDHIAYIARTTCDTPAISSTFITGVKNIFQYYLVKANRSAIVGPRVEPDQVAWTLMTAALGKCAEKVDSIQLTHQCGVVDQYIDKSGNLKDVGTIEELFDSEFTKGSPKGIDIIVDSVWWMFATTYARCYSALYPNKEYIVHLFSSFRDDILGFFHNRWRGAGEFMNDFNLVFGAIDAIEEHKNLRFCTYAAFEYEGLLEQHLIRPVMSFEGNVPKPNYKVNEHEVINGNEIEYLES